MRRLLWLLLLVGCPAWVSAQGCPQQPLHDEFFTDPTARGYSTCASDGDLAGLNVDDVCVQGKLNAPCTGNSLCKVDQTVTRETIWEAIDPTELETLSRSSQANDLARFKQLDMIMQNTTFNMGLGAVRQKFFNVFTGPNSPLTNAAIAALQQKDVPRCQTVCHKGNGCSLSDVSLGLRGTP